MTTDSTTTVDDATLFLGEAWSDPIEAGIRDRIRGFIEDLIEEELAAALGRGRYRARPTVRRPVSMSRGLPVPGTVIANDGSAARSGQSGLLCRGRASAPPAAGPPRGRAGCCRATPG